MPSRSQGTIASKIKVIKFYFQRFGNETMCLKEAVKVVTN